MRTTLFTGMIVLLLLAAPTQTYALGLAEYGQEAVTADEPVLSLPRLNNALECLKGWQISLATYSFREMVLLRFQVSQLLLIATLLTGYLLGRRGLRKSLLKARRLLHPLKPESHGRGLLSPQ